MDFQEEGSEALSKFIGTLSSAPLLPSCPIQPTLPSQPSTFAPFRAIGANCAFLGHVFEYLKSFLVQANSPLLPVVSHWNVSWSPLTPLATVHWLLWVWCDIIVLGATHPGEATRAAALAAVPGRTTAPCSLPGTALLSSPVPLLPAAHLASNLLLPPQLISLNLISLP